MGQLVHTHPATMVGPSRQPWRPWQSWRLWRPWRASLSTKYGLVLGVLVSGTLLTSSAVQTYFSVTERREALISLQREKANVAAARIEQFLREIALNMDWASIPAPGAGLGPPPPPGQGADLGLGPPPVPETIPGERRVVDLTRLLMQAPPLMEASYYNPDGREVAHVFRRGPPVVNSRADVSREPAFVETRQGRTYYSTVAFRGGAPHMTIAIPDGGPRFGVIAVDVDLSPVRDLILQMRFGQDGQAYLVDINDRPIASSDTTVDLTREELDKLPQLRAARSPNQSAGTRAVALLVPNVKGKQVLSAFQTIEPTGWAVFVEQPVDEVFAPLTSLLVRTGLLLLVGIGVSGAVSFILARRLVTPIRALRAGAARIGAGALDQRMAVSTGDELEDLAEEFNHMAAQLQESYATLEQRVVERTRELAAALEDLGAARDAALEATRAKSAFLASMSHELRTPLNAVIGFAEVLSDPEMPVDDATRAEFIRDILTAGRHLLQLINDILDLSKVEAGKMEFYPEDFDVAGAVRGVEAVARALTDKKRQRLEVTVDPAIETVHHDPARFKQVLFNLVSNAVKFTPEGGTVSVSAYHGGKGWLEVAVSDTGIGIKPEDQATIFEEFRQIDSGHNRQQQGTGLGLALVRRFVQIMGGTIWVESSIGQGSTFTFRLPLRHREPQPAAVGDPGASVVLVVEDNPQASALLELHLSRGGYQVERAADVETAWEKIMANRPAAITLDVQLPEQPHGWQLLRHLKQEPSTRDIPVIVVSILDDMGEAKQLGAEAHLVKPVDPRQLLEIVERLVRRAPLVA